VIDAVEWLLHARSLVGHDSPTSTDTRRSISASYYAVFHSVSDSAASFVAGGGDAGQVRLIRRSLNHERLRLVSRETLKHVPGRELAPFWPSGGFGDQLRRLSQAVLDLQEFRHAADYDPAMSVDAETARVVNDLAASAMEELASAPSRERELWLLLVLLRPPGRA
jgi:hypothetical protein